ncbi:MAG TPA: response regulator [Polyangiaceae bacterium]|jgi:two-component system response regulator RegA|nr:response regulator [Polyangiaceae bacterium]
MSDDPRRQLLVVDDDATYRARLLRAFTDRGLDARGAGSAPEALALAREDSPELAVVDLKMPGPSGLELVAALKAIDPTTNVVVVTGYGSIATALEAVRLGATHYLTKPCDADEILAAFDRGAEPLREPSATSEIEAPSLARAEWEHIHRVLTDCGGNISEAARRLGLHRRSLQRKIAKYPTAR